MSKRNFILLIIVLVIITAVAFLFFSSSKAPATPTSSEGGTNFFAKFNPFKKSEPTPPPTEEEFPTDISGNEIPTDITQTELRLKKISSMPVAGFGIFLKERLKETLPTTVEDIITEKPITKKPVSPLTEFVPALRYVDRATGNIYQTFADKINEEKFSSTIIPKVYEAYFGDKGEKVVMRYLKENDMTIETFAGVLPKEVFGKESTGLNELKGTFLPENVTDMSVSPDLLKIFYLLEGTDNVAGITADMTGEKRHKCLVLHLPNGFHSGQIVV